MFWTIIFWLIFIGFLTNPHNFIIIILYSEILWMTLYCLVVLCGCIRDDINLVSLSLFILGFAGFEYAVGFLLLILFKNFTLAIDFQNDQKIWKHYLLKNEKYFYNIFNQYK